MLEVHADVALARANKHYFRSPFSFLGVTKKEINQIGAKLRRDLRGADRDSLLQVISELWRSRVHEQMSLAVVLAALCIDEFASGDASGVFAEWLDECRTWDHVDELCIRVIGPLALRHPSLWRTIARWAAAKSLWKRRASLIAHLPSIRLGDPRTDLLTATCVDLSAETDLFVRKAIGWVLRELSDEDKNSMFRVFRAVGSHLSPLSRREATRKLPIRERVSLLQTATKMGDRHASASRRGRVAAAK